ncbi:MAG: SRPBCC family protein [Bacteroidetes bacterium]|nr:SRPBCC family protein [Bacteroidota bacterium]
MIALDIIASIIGLIAFLALVVPVSFTYEAEIIVNKSKAEVFDYLKHLKNQNYWSVWILNATDMVQEYSGTDGQPGFISAWEGKKAGKGAQELLKVADGERIDTELRFEKPFKANNKGYFITTTVDATKTKIVWGMSGNSPRPFNIVSVLMKGRLLKDFNQGLANAQKNLEKKYAQ